MCMARNHRFPILLTAEERARLDEMRGSLSRGAFIRARVFGERPEYTYTVLPCSRMDGSPLAPEETARLVELREARAAQDELSAPIDPAPPPPPKQELILP